MTALVMTTRTMLWTVGVGVEVIGADQTGFAMVIATSVCVLYGVLGREEMMGAHSIPVDDKVFNVKHTLFPPLDRL